MFPAKLHKNLLQLEREISVLEIESQNMDFDKKKIKCVTSQNRISQSCKSTETCGRAAPATNTTKKKLPVSRLKKVSPASSRIHSTSSVPSNCTKQCNKICEVFQSPRSYKTSETDLKTFAFCVCQAQTQGVCSKNINPNKVKSSCQPKESKTKLKSNNLNNITSNYKKDSVIHKEVLFTNPDGSVEVTVKQKSNIQNPKRNDMYGQVLAKNLQETDICNCQCTTDRKQNLAPKWSQILSLEYPNQHEDNKYKKMLLYPATIDEACNRNCTKKKVTETAEETSSKVLPALNITDKSYDSCTALKSQNEVFQTIRKLCDNLISEKDLLTQEVAAKNCVIANMKKREDEYKSLISGLKVNLNKAKESSKANTDVINELKNTKRKLLEQAKVLEGLKKGNLQLQETLDKHILENDRLKTQIQIYKLECQKHDVLIAGKEVEIKRYKEEIWNFQRQISEHLGSLKSNSQTVDMKKLMEAIIQQSQIFVHDDSQIFHPDGNSGDYLQQNRLMHSSPTSTKTSDVNSSWKQISSIKTQEPPLDINISQEKEFYQIYGGDFSVSSDPPKMRVSSLAFTSCPSIHNDSPQKVETNNHKRFKHQNIVNSSPEKLKHDIDHLLSGMKLKFSKQIHELTTHDNETIDDFLNGSLVSDICD